MEIGDEIAQTSYSEPGSPRSPISILKRTRTVSFASDSTLSFQTAVGGFDTSSEAAALSRSPSASSFFSFVSEEFYDPYPESIQINERTTTTTAISGYDNSAFIGDDGMSQLPPYEEKEKETERYPNNVTMNNVASGLVSKIF